MALLSWLPFKTENTQGPTVLQALTRVGLRGTIQTKLPQDHEIVLVRIWPLYCQKEPTRCAPRMAATTAASAFPRTARIIDAGVNMAFQTLVW